MSRLGCHVYEEDGKRPYVMYVCVCGWRGGENMDELPEWTVPFTDCYTGPNWSDGKWQGSTARGTCKPKSRLDELSRVHDASFALCTDLDCLDRADELYYQNSRDMSLVPRAIGAMPLYGNAIGRKVARFMGYGYTGAEAIGGVNEMKYMAAYPSPGADKIAEAKRLAEESKAKRAAENPTPAPTQEETPVPSGEFDSTVCYGPTEDTPIMKPTLILSSTSTLTDGGQYSNDGRYVNDYGQQIRGKGGFMFWDPFSNMESWSRIKKRNRRKICPTC